MVYQIVEHYLETLSKKPGALQNSQALYQAETQIKALYKKHFENLPAVFIEVLNFVTTNQIDPSLILPAVDQCIKKTLNSELTGDKIIWMIRSQLKSPSGATRNNPSALNQQIKNNCIKQLQDLQAIF